MTWTENNYPPQFKKYNPAVRSKLIETANRLIEEGEEEVAAVQSSITLVKEWAEEQGIQIEEH